MPAIFAFATSTVSESTRPVLPFGRVITRRTATSKSSLARAHVERSEALLSLSLPPVRVVNPARVRGRPALFRTNGEIIR